MTDYEKICQWWTEKRIGNGNALFSALNGFSVDFAYHSGKLENSRITFQDVKEIFDNDSVVAYTGDLKTLFEIHNEKQAYKLFLKAFDKKRPVEEGLVKEFQRALTENTYDERRWRLDERPGEYKKHNFVIGVHEIGAAAEDVPQEMQELLEELQDIPADRILTAAAYFHVKFENIHPFAEGNGRTGRLAMNYFLVTHDHPPITIHEEDRKSYYDALDIWDRTLDLKPLEGFLKEQCVKTWSEDVK